MMVRWRRTDSLFVWLGHFGLKLDLTRMPSKLQSPRYGRYHMVWKSRILGKIYSCFNFSTGRDRERVLTGAPWWFNKKILSLTAISGEETPFELTPHTSPIWVRVYELPLFHRTRATAKALGNKLGEFLEWDDTEDMRWGSSLRLRVRIDLESHYTGDR